ncbi:hypothetical protein thsps117_37160 [Pseudomonas sp. No.117]
MVLPEVVVPLDVTELLDTLLLDSTDDSSELLLVVEEVVVMSTP